MVIVFSRRGRYVIAVEDVKNLLECMYIDTILEKCITRFRVI